MSGLEEIRDQLAVAIEALADEALRLLRVAQQTGDDLDRRDVLAAEKRITRARRAVEKAAHLLDGDAAGDDGD